MSVTAQMELFTGSSFYCEHCRGNRGWKFRLHEFKKSSKVRVVTTTCTDCRKTTKSEYPMRRDKK